MSFVCAAEMQNRARDSMIGVAGKPTTTTPMFLFNISLPNALEEHVKTKMIKGQELLIVLVD